MLKIFKIFIGILILVFSGYGIYHFISTSLTKSRGEQLVENQFVQGVATKTAEKLRENLLNTPDDKLEKESEQFTRKMYPIIKGALKGQMEAIKEDSQRADFPKEMYETGKQLSERILQPFVKGFIDGSGKNLGDLDRTVQELKMFTEKNKDVLDSIGQGLSFLNKTLKNLPPPPHPGPLAPRLPDNFPRPHGEYPPY